MGHVVSTPETVGFLLVPRFSMIAFTAALEPLRLANHISGRQLYRWALISPEGGVGEASCGLRIAVDHAMDAAPSLPTVIVCSGVDGHWYDDRRVLSWLRRRAAEGVGAGVALHRQPHPCPRRAAQRLPLHDPLGKPRGLRRNLSGDRGDRRAVQHRPQPLHLRRRHRRDGHDAVPHRQPPMARSWRYPSPNNSSTTRSARDRCASTWRSSPIPASTARNWPPPSS